MLLCFIIGGLMLLTAVIALVLCFTSKVDKKLLTQIITSGFIFGILLSSLGLGLRLEAVRTYQELQKQKEFIETNINSEDYFTQMQVSNEYSTYKFKYDRVLNNGGILINPYLGMDLDALKLNIK